MDNTDKLIIEELKKNSKITMKELGNKVHLSGQAASNRVMKLEDLGIIKKYTIDVNYPLYGYPVHAMITVYTKYLTHNQYIEFIEAQEYYVLHNYKISGDGCYLLECNFPSNEIMDEFLVSLSKIVNYKLNIILRDTTESQID